MKVINMFGSPGCGKSTQAAGLFYKMKLAGLNVELVTEYAKDLVWQDRLDSMADQQDYIFAKQHHRLHRLRGKVDYVVTDSPIILGIAYMKHHNVPVIHDLVTLMLSTFNRFDNFNFLLERGDIPYKAEGRRQDEVGSNDVGNDIKRILMDNSIRHIPVVVNPGQLTVTEMNRHVREQLVDKYPL